MTQEKEWPCSCLTAFDKELRVKFKMYIPMNEINECPSCHRQRPEPKTSRLEERLQCILSSYGLPPISIHSQEMVKDLAKVAVEMCSKIAKEHLCSNPEYCCCNTEIAKDIDKLARE